MNPRDLQDALADVHDTFNAATLAAAEEKLRAIERLTAKARAAGLEEAQIGSANYAERFKGSMRLVKAEDDLTKAIASERGMMP